MEASERAGGNLTAALGGDVASRQEQQHADDCKCNVLTVYIHSSFKVRHKRAGSPSQMCCLRGDNAGWAGAPWFAREGPAVMSCSLSVMRCLAACKSLVCCSCRQRAQPWLVCSICGAHMTCFPLEGMAVTGCTQVDPFADCDCASEKLLMCMYITAFKNRACRPQNMMQRA